MGKEDKRKRLTLIIAGVAVILLVCVGAVILKYVLHQGKGQQYTYIDYNEGTTREINYYIDDEGHAYRYDGIKKIYVLLSPDVLEKNKAGDLTIDSRDMTNTEPYTALPSESVSN